MIWLAIILLLFIMGFTLYDLERQLKDIPDEEEE